MKQNRQHAFTLYELLIALAVMSIGMTMALPALSSLKQHSEREALRNHLHASIDHARLQAVLNKTTVELCGSRDGLNCSRDWSRGWRIQLYHSPAHTLLVQKNRTSQPLQWAGFDQRIRFYANGTSPSSNGRFFQCRNSTVAWQLILNRQGRARIARADENLAEGHRCESKTAP
ncbi:GspH/FimT family pseudopilin [Ectopseudomonas oleovorans]|uniref:GspH/FimT family pseudopilin n=1 Tax=Ectopseudomonas oleovorans TaxID=301 RepID=UPI000E6AA84D|nr:GspH/FimT family pseudopilin [Pseudomonas oleovorans]